MRGSWSAKFKLNQYHAIAPGIIYHIVIAEHYRRTLCGLYVVGDMRMIEDKPEDRILCPRCERESSNRKVKELTKEKAA